MRRRWKVERLVATIDARATAAGFDPHGRPGEVATILERRATEERWRQYAELAGVNPPSKLTQDAVIEVYRKRADAIEAMTAANDTIRAAASTTALVLDARGIVNIKALQHAEAAQAHLARVVRHLRLGDDGAAQEGEADVRKALARLRAELEADPEQERPSRPSLRPLAVAMLNETAAALSRAGLAQETEVRNAG